MSTHTSKRFLWSLLYWSPSIVFLAPLNIFQAKAITGRSMQPTLNPDSSERRDVILCSNWGLWQPNGIGRGDIVTLRSPQDPKMLLVKRIVAMEGDTVKTLPPYPDLEVTVPEGHVWIEGDEHFMSGDSNQYGPVSRSLIESKMVMIIWPPSRFGIVDESTNLPENSPLNDAQKRAVARLTRVRISNLLSSSDPSRNSPQTSDEP